MEKLHEEAASMADRHHWSRDTKRKQDKNHEERLAKLKEYSALSSERQARIAKARAAHSAQISAQLLAKADRNRAANYLKDSEKQKPSINSQVQTE